MKKIYITFSGAVYDEITKKIVEDAPRLGADEVWVYDDVWLTHHDFYKHNKWLWEHPHKRGFGWYAWKPLIILDALSRVNDGDIVMFTDADTYPVRDFSILYDICNKEGAMFFEVTGETSRKWCKRDCFIVMGQDDPKYYDTQAGVARFILFKKGEWKPYQLLMEWLTYCVNPKATTFDKSTIGSELDGFVEHRTEQAIMTLLVHKYSYRLYREACEIGEIIDKDRDLYEQLFSQLNPWNKKNKKNISAPALGSKYRNVPLPDEKGKRIDSIYKSSDKNLMRNNLLILKNTTKLKMKKIISKIIPKKIKEKIQKLSK